MSTTRINRTGDFKPERWSSSPAFDRALKANLVAARCSVLDSAELRELVWFVQALSIRRGGLRWVATEIAPDNVPTADTEKWLSGLCLNPETNQELVEVAPQLRELLARYSRQASEGGATTGIVSQINEALDYCSQMRGLVFISGRPRIGKTWAAKKWVDSHPGRARYCEVPGLSDDLSFFTALARALGVTIESNAKRKNLQPRVEAALRGGDLVLVLDESAALWPCHNYRPPSRPARIGWVMAMINAGASIALLVTPNFFASQQDYLDHTRWQDAQFYGRISRFVSLPERLSISDLESVARAWLPHGDRRAIESLADVANLSQKHLAAIEHTVTLANYFARRDGRECAAWPDVQRAIKEGVMPTDTNLAAAVLNASDRRVTSANGSRS